MFLFYFSWMILVMGHAPRPSPVCVLYVQAGSCHNWGYWGSFPGTRSVSTIPSPLWIGPTAQQIVLCWENAVARGQMSVPRGLVL